MPVVLGFTRQGTGPSGVWHWKCPFPAITTIVTKKKVLCEECELVFAPAE